ncbi:MAG: ATP-binding cassette domain-containing protein, partial [Pseudolabrys sp.]
GMVFQGYTLFPWLTVRKNVMFGLEINGKDRYEAERQAMQWLQLVGLEKFAECHPHQLSGGMKQRVAIVRALANQPRILLMDEPFGALDAQTRARMQAHLMEIWRKIDITIVFITHDLDEAIFLSDRILVLSAHPGEVQELIEVPVPYPRNPGQFITPEFLATKARLEELIHKGAAHDADEDEGTYKMVTRLTDVTDDVD